MREWESTLTEHSDQLLAYMVAGDTKRQKTLISKLENQELAALRRGEERNSKRKAERVKGSGEILPYRVFSKSGEKAVDYLFVTSFLIRLKKDFYMEEIMQKRRATFDGKKLLEDKIISVPYLFENNDSPSRFFSQERRSFQYDRREAIRYAERWWNDYNPQYEKFTDNCTNFISQCLRAGNAPMRGYPNRSQGWWYQNNNWSYSWSVAHSMRWYLSGSTQGLSASEAERAEDLEAGDVICYDFNGDGRWQHTTIVTAKDANNEPLVNAQTTNSRMRYWHMRIQQPGRLT